MEIYRFGPADFSEAAPSPLPLEPRGCDTFSIWRDKHRSLLERKPQPSAPESSQAVHIHW